MATITSISSGNWTDPSIWDLGRKPQDGDDVVIGNGTTVIYDEDMSSWTTGVSIKIDGTSTETRLKCHRTQNTCLKLKATLIGSNKAYSIFDWGTANDPIQAKAIITRSGTAYINGLRLQIYLFGKDPGIYWTTITQDTSAGSNIIYVNLSNGFNINVGDKIVIEVDYNSKPYPIQIRVVTAIDINTGQITLDNNLNFATKAGYYVCNLSRNVYFDGNNKYHNWIVYLNNNQHTKIFGVEFENNIYTAVSFAYDVEFEKCSFHKGIQICRVEQLPILIKDCVYASSTYVSYNLVYMENCFIFYGNFNDYAELKNCKLLNVPQIQYGKTTKIKLYNCFLRNFYAFFGFGGNIELIECEIEKLPSQLYTHSRNVGENKIIGNTTVDLTDLMKINNPDDFLKYSRFYQKGKSIFLWTGRCGRIQLDSSNMKMMIENWNPTLTIDEGIWWDWKIHCESGYEYKFRVRGMKDADMGFAKFQICDENNDPLFFGNDALAEAELIQVNQWQDLEITFIPVESKVYTIRLWAGGSSGFNVWWSADPRNDNYFEKQIQEQIIQQKDQECAELLARGRSVGEKGFDVIDLSDKKTEIIEL